MVKYFAVIVLPMYNEELSIPSLRTMFDGNIPMPPGCDYRIVVVNDGSNDGTLNLVNAWIQENRRVSVVSHSQNLGLGQAILTGFAEAIRMGANCVVTMDADASHPGDIINELITAVLKGADIAIASRFAEGGQQIGVPFMRRIYSQGARNLLSLFFPLKGVRDYTVGFRAYRTHIVNQALSRKEDSFLRFRSFAAMVEILLKIATLANKINEVPFVLRYDHKQSPSKLRFWSTVRDYVRLCFLPKKKCYLGRGLRID